MEENVTMLTSTKVWTKEKYSARVGEHYLV